MVGNDVDIGVLTEAHPGFDEATIPGALDLSEDPGQTHHRSCQPEHSRQSNPHLRLAVIGDFFKITHLTIHIGNIGVGLGEGLANRKEGRDPISRHRPVDCRNEAIVIAELLFEDRPIDVCVRRKLFASRPTSR